MRERILDDEKPRLNLGMIGIENHGKGELTQAIQKRLERHKTRDSRDDVYDALVSLGGVAGKCVTVIAKSLAEARSILESEYGKGSVVSLGNRELGNKARTK